MYNEVFDNCPNCGQHSGYLQIDQLVLGFGKFDLADLGLLKARIADGELSRENVYSMVAALGEKRAMFQCRGCDVDLYRPGYGPDEPDCTHRWHADPATILAVMLLAQEDPTDVCKRALDMLAEAGIR
jgi:hypothetical protein